MKTSEFFGINQIFLRYNMRNPQTQQLFPILQKIALITNENFLH